MYKIDRRGRGVQKSYTRTDPNRVLVLSNFAIGVLESVNEREGGGLVWKIVRGNENQVILLFDTQSNP